MKKIEWPHMPKSTPNSRSLGIDGDLTKMRAGSRENLERSQASHAVDASRTR
jgi:hypothetical protein